jgi:hypothetical protein
MDLNAQKQGLRGATEGMRGTRKQAPREEETAREEEAPREEAASREKERESSWGWVLRLLGRAVQGGCGSEGRNRSLQYTCGTE